MSSIPAPSIAGMLSVEVPGSVILKKSGKYSFEKLHVFAVHVYTFLNSLNKCLCIYASLTPELKIKD